MMLGTLMNKDRRSLRNPPKNGTTLQSGMSSERLTASRYSSVSSRDIRAPHSHLKVDRSSSTIDSQNGFNLSDLEWAIQMKHIFIKFSHYSWIRKNSSVILKKIKKNLFFWRNHPNNVEAIQVKMIWEGWISHSLWVGRSQSTELFWVVLGLKYFLSIDGVTKYKWCSISHR